MLSAEVDSVIAANHAKLALKRAQRERREAKVAKQIAKAEAELSKLKGE